MGTAFTITATSGTEPIRYIKVKSGGCATSSETFVNVAESGGTIPYIRSIQKISASPLADSEVRIATVLISGGLGDPGSPGTSTVSADSINTLICGGEITADITSGPRQAGGTSNIASVQSDSDISGDIRAIAGSVTEVIAAGNISGAVLSDVASIGSVSAGGDISGPIKALNGSIGSIIATGDFTTPLDGATFQVRAKDGIDTIVAHSITAYITACSNCTSSIGTGAGVVGLVKTTGGDFTHSIAMRSLSTSTLSGESGIIVNGSVPSGAVMRFISSGSVSQPITITGSLGGTIQYDSAGALSNQIIVNAANSGGTWGGSVLVDGITLNSGQSQPNQAPYYNQTSSTLGGGAVGLAPFHLHGADCSPANGSSGNSFGSPIRLRFYGPVTWSSGEPVSVDVQDSDGGSFTVSISAGSDPRDILVSVSAGNPMDVPDQIVIQPVSGVLKCANVTGTPNVASFTYSISY